MKDKLKNIYNLSKMYIIENDMTLRLIDKDTKRINKKSFLFWIYIVLFFSISYLSTEAISFLGKTGKPEIFINILFSILEFFIVFRTIMVSLNVFYFSKEIENILHLPLKPIEILISKLITIIFINYEIEFLIAAIPIFIYGTNYYSPMFFTNALIVLIIFPIFITIVVSIIMIFTMKFIKFFRNKDLMQIVISFILIFIVMAGILKSLEYVFNNYEHIEENQSIIVENVNNKIIKVNSYFLNINPSVDIILKNDIFVKIISFIKLLTYNILVFVLFIFLGNKFYLKELLKANFYYKKNRKKSLKRIGKTNNYNVSYIKKEFKLLLRNPLFFIQYLYPIITITVSVIVLLFTIIPIYNEILKREEYKDLLEQLVFNFEAVCLIIGVVQVIGLFNYTSVTAFSREGKNAFIIKTLPISLFKQFMIKNIPQVLVNTISTFFVLLVFKIKIPAIELKYIVIIFIISSLLTIINSLILCLIDLLMPKLDWDAEYEILKNNKNKLLQYVLIVANIIFLMFINKVFKNHNLDKSLIILLITLFVFLTLFVIGIKKQSKKLFNKIN